MTRTLIEIEKLFEEKPVGSTVALTKEERQLWEASFSTTKAINTQIAQEQQLPSIAEVLAERGSRYGAFKDHAAITQSLKEQMKQGRKWADLSFSQKEALEMIAHKIGRILNGDPNYLDSWVDIVGYTQLVIDELTEKEKAK